MCLYPHIIRNPRYKPSKKNGGNVPTPDDERKLWVAIGCGKCIECRRKKVREWRIRIENEVKYNEIRGKGITLSFSEDALNSLPIEANSAAARAIMLFLKRWHKEKGKALRHWFIVELGHENTERVHLHGIVWTKHLEDIERIWRYGNIKTEPLTEDTVNYLIKYVNKPDKQHDGFIGKIFASKGIGQAFLDSHKAQEIKKKGAAAPQYLKLADGRKIDIPMYWRKKLFTEDQREKIWTNLLDKQERWVMGQRIDVSTKTGMDLYYKTLKYEQKINARNGYPKQPWTQKKYQESRKKLDENLEIPKNLHCFAPTNEFEL